MIIHQKHVLWKMTNKRNVVINIFLFLFIKRGDDTKLCFILKIFSFFSMKVLFFVDYFASFFIIAFVIMIECKKFIYYGKWGKLRQKCQIIHLGLHSRYCGVLCGDNYYCIHCSLNLLESFLSIFFIEILEEMSIFIATE